MASYQQRCGSWRAIITKKGFTRLTRTFDKKADAEAWARQVESEMDRGIYVSRKEAENTPLEDALDRYEREIIPSKKGGHIEAVRIRNWKRSSLAKRSLASIQGKDVATYRDTRLKGNEEKGTKPAAPNTVRLELAILSHVFTIAIKEWGMGGIINPVLHIRQPPPGKARERRVTPDEIEYIVNHTESPTLANIVRIAVETGMRRGEIVGMTWGMVNLKKRTVTLPETKNGDRRIVPLSPEAVRILEGIPRRIDGEVWGLDDPHSVTTAFRKAVARARAAYLKDFEGKRNGEKNAKPDPSFLLDLTFHDLRHEATSRFFEKGLNPMQVAAITGHKTLQMLKRYTHLKAEDLAELLK